MAANQPSANLDKNVKTERYAALKRELAAVLHGGQSPNADPLVAMVTLNALIKKHIPYAYWVGFYRWTGSALAVGPYQGTLGCLSIPARKGVCGTSFAENRPICVPDTHAFPGHIACDPSSLSEIVIPYYGQSLQPLGVLDVDSAELASFDDVDQLNLDQCLKEYLSPLLP